MNDKRLRAAMEPVAFFDRVNAMHELVEKKRQDIGRLCGRFDVRRLEVFGSAARGADFQPGRSDVDFLVEYDPTSCLSPLEGFFGLQAELSRLLGQPVDLVEVGAIRNPYVLTSIDQNRELVYAA